MTVNPVLTPGIISDMDGQDCAVAGIWQETVSVFREVMSYRTSFLHMNATNTEAVLQH